MKTFFELVCEVPELELLYATLNRQRPEPVKDPRNQENRDDDENRPIEKLLQLEGLADLTVTPRKALT